MNFPDRHPQCAYFALEKPDWSNEPARVEGVDFVQYDIEDRELVRHTERFSPSPWYPDIAQIQRAIDSLNATISSGGAR